MEGWRFGGVFVDEGFWSLMEPLGAFESEIFEFLQISHKIS
jgi:hypothetical protein